MDDCFYMKIDLLLKFNYFLECFRFFEKNNWHLPKTDDVSSFLLQIGRLTTAWSFINIRVVLLAIWVANVEMGWKHRPNQKKKLPSKNPFILGLKLNIFDLIFPSYIYNLSHKILERFSIGNKKIRKINLGEDIA